MLQAVASENSLFERAEFPIVLAQWKDIRFMVPSFPVCLSTGAQFAVERKDSVDEELHEWIGCAVKLAFSFFRKPYCRSFS